MQQVANAVVAQALGDCDQNVLDGTPAINAAAGQPKATGLSDFLSAASKSASDLSAKAQSAASN